MALGPRGIAGGGGANANITVTTTVAQSLAALNTLKSSFASLSSSITRSIGGAASAFGPMDFHLRRINANIVATGFALAGVAKQAGDFVERGAKMELFSKRMETVSGSVKAAEEDMANLIKFTEGVPFKLEETTRSFIKLKTAGIEPLTKDGGGPLRALVDAMAAFGGTSEQLDRATAAIVQMAGKGTISMEELRQQLGEAVPTAIRIFAREMDMTVGKFIKQVSLGRVSADNLGKLFLGLEKNYAGAAAKMMNTFIGATQQMDTALDVLAKTIFVDTGTMRYFTAAVQIATDKIKEFDRFMRTAEGQKWIDDAWKGFQKLGIYIADAVEPARQVVNIIGDIASAVASVTDSLPPEIVGGGLLGYVFFGRAGLVAGAIFGAFNKEISGVTSATSKAIKEIDSSFSGFGGTMANAAIGGLIGFRLAGPRGALVGAVAGALASVLANWDQILDQILIKHEEFKQRMINGISINDMKPDEVADQSWWDWLIPKFEWSNEDSKPIIDEIQKLRDKLAEDDINVPVRVDLPEVGSELTNGEWAKRLFEQVEQRAKEGSADTLQVIDGFSADLVKKSRKIQDISIADFAPVAFTDKETAIPALQEYSNNIGAEIDKIQDQISKLNEQQKINVPGLNTEAMSEDITKLEADKVRLEKSVTSISKIITDLESKKKNQTSVPLVKVDTAQMSSDLIAIKEQIDKLEALKDQAEQGEPIDGLKISVEGTNQQIAVLKEKFKQISDARDAAVADYKNNAVVLDVYVPDIDSKIEFYKSKLQGASDALNDVNAKLAQNSPDVNIVDKEKLDAQVAFLNDRLQQAVRIKQDTDANLAKIAELPTGGLAGQTTELLQSVQQYVAGLDKSFQSIEKKKSTLQDFASAEQQLREQMQSGNYTQEQRNELLNAANAIQAELVDGMKLVAEQTSKANAPIEENAKYVQRLNNDIADLQQRAQDMTLGQSWTGEAERMREAGNSIADTIGDIKLKIEEIREAQAKGLITPESANAAIANLNSIASAVEGSKGRIISAASDINQAWQTMGREIYSAIESALGDAIYNLVTGAKSMKDVLLDLWKSVTRAVSNYIAKLLMAGLFGGGQSGGGLFGSLFGSGGMNTGGTISFAEGGSAIVDGRTGFDKNNVSMRVSRGERVTVETAAQQKANSRISGGAVYNIYALDGNSVERMLLQHGGVLKNAIDGRTRLNK
jgi:tape measure domain-containing protein